MATLIHTRINISHRLAGGVLDLAAPARRVIAALLDRHQQRREIAHLLTMDDRALADIGLTRADAQWIANRRGPAIARTTSTPVVTGSVIDFHVRRAHDLRGAAIAEAANRIGAAVRRIAARIAHALRRET